jgi:predicted TIM-barrel fold metal-dependent hydrolase
VSYELALIMSSSTAIVSFVQKWGPERLLFGSDYYEGMHRRFPVALHEVRDSDLPAEAQAQILGGNTARLLGLTAS